MIRMGTVWDQTVEVLQGRSRILAGIALPFFFLPSVANGAVSAWSGGAGGGGAGAIGAVVGLAVFALTLFGMLAITAIASDPAADARAARGIAGARMGKAIVVLLVVGVVGAVVALIVGGLFYAAGVRVDASGEPDMSAVTPGWAGVLTIVTLALLVAALWLTARLAALFPVVVNEARGVAAFGRSFALTRGSAGRLIGVLILFMIVVAVALGAASGVTAVVARLILGGDAQAGVAFVASIAGAVVSSIAAVVQTVFYARFYALALAAKGDSAA